MTHTADLNRLLAALDAGDDSVLPVLADLLEEQGDRRAAGLRRLPAAPSGLPGRQAHFVKLTARMEEIRAADATAWTQALRPDLFTALTGATHCTCGKGTEWADFPSRSAAFLALAEALAAG